MGKARGLSAERIAKYILINEGYNILAEREIFKIEDVEIAEIDYVVQDANGEKYIVEVKAGDIDVSAIRNLYANAKTLNMKPLLIGRGYSNTAAEVLAKKLGISVLFFRDYFLMLDPLDLEVILRGVLTDIFNEYGIKPIPFTNLTDKEKSILSLLSSGLTIEEISEKLNLNQKEVYTALKMFRKKGILPKHEKNYSQLIKYAQNVTFWTTLTDKLTSLEIQLQNINNQLEQLKNELKNKNKN